MPRRLLWILLCLVAVILPWAIPVSAAQSPGDSWPVPAGSGLYSNYCAVCHGTDAKGTMTVG